MADVCVPHLRPDRDDENMRTTLDASSAGASGNAQQDLTTIAGGSVSPNNPTIPRLYAPATNAGGSPCKPWDSHQYLIVPCVGQTLQWPSKHISVCFIVS